MLYEGMQSFMLSLSYCSFGEERMLYEGMQSFMLSLSYCSFGEERMLCYVIIVVLLIR